MLIKKEIKAITPRLLQLDLISVKPLVHALVLQFSQRVLQFLTSKKLSIARNNTRRQQVCSATELLLSKQTSGEAETRFKLWNKSHFEKIFAELKFNFRISHAFAPAIWRDIQNVHTRLAQNDGRMGRRRVIKVSK